MRYYNTDQIRKIGAHYNYVIGERSNGKTTALLRDIVSDYHKNGYRGAVIRQMAEDVRGARAEALFSGVIDGGMIDELTDGKWSGVKHRSGKFWLTRVNEKGEIEADTEPFCFIFALSQTGRYKGNSFPRIGTIFFDEFIPLNRQYLNNEVHLFLNMVSTLVREKDHAKIFLVANSITWNSPYFKQMGLKHVSKMKPGEIATVEHSKTTKTGKVNTTKIAIEYCEDTQSYGGKASDVFFAFDDEATAMITDGQFSVPEYPECPHHFTRRDVKCTYWFDSDDPADVDRKIMRGRLIRTGDMTFVFVDELYEKEFARLWNERKDVVYRMEFSPHPSQFISPATPYKDTRTHYMADMIKTSRLFFESSDIGENFTHFVREAGRYNIMDY